MKGLDMKIIRTRLAGQAPAKTDPAQRKADLLARIAAASALLAWLALAGDALAQGATPGANQWAPGAGSAPTQGNQTGNQTWSPANPGLQFAPPDLEQQLSATGPTTVVRETVVTPATSQIYAPPGTATTTLPAPAAPATPGYGLPATVPYGYPYGYGYGALPYAGAGLGAPYSGAWPYGLPYAPGLGAWPLGYGLTYPAADVWSPPLAGYGGLPLFGGSPFGFW